MLNQIAPSDTHQIWAEFGDRLRGFIARRVASEADADDILQDVFLRIHRHAGTLEQRERLTSWLFQITRNAIVDYYRAPARRRELLSGAAQDLERDWDQAMAFGEEIDIPSSGDQCELASCLRPLIEQLPEHYRQAVALADLEGLPQKEVADRSGVSLSGMKSRVQRGRQALGEMLQECCHIERDAGGRVSDYQLRGSGCGPCGAESARS
jgi:RNA polymerase sigma-70 factor (ECF subfamily)